MNKIICTTLALILFSNAALADCDFSKVVKNSDTTYTYSKELHICVGQLVEDDSVHLLQLEDLNKAIALKDDALKASDQRTQLWMDTSIKLEENIAKMENIRKSSDWIYFGLGVLTTFAAGMAAASLVNKH